MTLGRNAKDEFSDIMDTINDHVELADYIIKSPPKEKQNNALVRWCMRWFVIYYNKAQNRCWLLYFQNEDAFLSGKLPKGKIDLKLSKIKEHKSPINKYEYVIDIISVKRTFYLCFLNRKIYQKWLKMLKEFHAEMWSSQVQENDNNNYIKNNNSKNQPQQPLPYNANNHRYEENLEDNEAEYNEGYLDTLDAEFTLQIPDDHQRDETIENDRYVGDRSDLLERLQLDDDDDDSVDGEKELDDVFDETTSIASNRSSISYQTYTPPLSLHRNSIDVGAIRSHHHSPYLLNKRKQPSRSTTIPKNINELLLESPSKHDKRYSSLQEVSMTHRSSISPLNTHLEMLARLERAAAKRPLSDGFDYDMGGFTGPRFNYPHK